MGDDGVGWHLVEVLRRSSELPADAVEVAWGGTDLLAVGDLLAGRERIVLVDAVAAAPGEAAGRVLDFDPDDPALDRRSAGAHALSLPGALALLRRTTPGLAGADVRLLGVTVAEVRAGEALSPELARSLPEIARRVLAALRARALSPNAGTD